MFFKTGITQDCPGEEVRADPCFRPIFSCLALPEQVCVSPVFLEILFRYVCLMLCPGLSMYGARRRKFFENDMQLCLTFTLPTL